MRSPTRPGQNAIQPSSIGWFDLPFEMREIVIDQMDSKTRCKFAQCSKLCEEEAKKSKNYLYKIGITEQLGIIYSPQILVSHTNKLEWDYLLNFFSFGRNQTIVSYECASVLGLNAKWTKLETGKPENVRRKYFNEYTEKYNHSIREFFSRHFTSSVIGYKIKNLRNLKKLKILAHPFQDDSNKFPNLVECGFIEMEQLIPLEDLFAPSSILTFEQVFKLKAGCIVVSSEDFSEENINKYLRMMKKGENQENTESIYICLSQRNRFKNVQNVMNGLDIFNYSAYRPPTFSYTFNFLSDVKKNGMFRVTLRPQELIEIQWIEAAKPV